jgi:hypothetical protein
MLVGHLPFLEKLTSLLLCGNEKTRLVLFRYGAIVCLEQREDKGWGVRWILTPEMIGLLTLTLQRKGRWACFQSFTIADRFYVLWETFDVT